MGLNPEARHLNGWTPSGLEWVGDEPRLEWCFTEGFAFNDPFFADTLARCWRLPARLLFRHQTTMDYLGQLARQRPGLIPAGLIFHGSRGGSTLVTQMLSTLSSTLVLSEPGPLDAVLRARRQRPELADPVHQDWLRWTVSALGQPTDEGQEHLVIKLDAWSILDLALVQRAFPTTPWAFVYRDPVEVLVSQLEHRGYHMVPGTLSPEALGLDPEPHPPLGPEEYAAAVLGRLYQAAVDGTGDGRGLLVNYDELPEAVGQRIAQHFGLAVTPTQHQTMAEAAGRNAKNPVLAFEADGADKQRRATQAIRAAAQRWVTASYRELEGRRRRASMADRVRLALPVDLAGLQADVASLPAQAWVPHFNQDIYEGDWSGVALRAAPGSLTELYPDPNAEVGAIEDTLWLSQCPSLRATLEQLECPITSARLLALDPGARIKDHSDHTLSHADGQVRLHIPIVSAPEVEFYLDDQPVIMAPGECWYLNLTLTHRAFNPSGTRRVHLVIDCIVDAWLEARLKEGVLTGVST